MPSNRDATLIRAEYSTPDALPEDARRLFGGDFFSTLTWYRTVTQACVPAGSRAVFVLFTAGDRACALFPMMVSGRQAWSLTTPYSCLWQPLLAEGSSAHDHAAIWHGFGQWCRQFTSVRLEAMDAPCTVPAPGLVALRFDQFGNWHTRPEAGWPAYLAARPGPLREAVRRRGKKLTASGANFTLVSAPDQVETGIAVYEKIYASSWKVAEPFPDFIAALMRACAADGSLRLGLLSLGDQPLAAQFWVVQGKWASVLKLAHDEAAKAHSPGTVLTALMIEALMTRDGVRELDFGRGDDTYKASWTADRRQRVGVVLANPRTLRGLALIARHQAGFVIRAARNLYAGVRPVPGKYGAGA
jgi:hypothetical protein